MKLKVTTISFLKNMASVLFTLTISQTIVAQTTGATVNCTFDTPRDSALPNLFYRSYNTDANFTGSITVIGKNGPDLSPYRKLDLAYVNGTINTFFFQRLGTFDQFNLIPHVSSQSLDKANPELTLSGTGVDNFDGSYYVTMMDNDAGPNFQDFIMVSKTGGFTIYFSYSDNPPNCTENFGVVEETAEETFIYDENVNGNLSLNNNAPTVIKFKPGNNRVASSQAEADDKANFFTFQIPDGYEVSKLFVESYKGSDDLGFMGIDEGSSIQTNPPSFIGGLSYGTVNIGTDILPAMGNPENPAAIAIPGFGFTPPLNAKQYTIWLNQTGDNSSTVLNFVVTADADNLSIIGRENNNNVVLKRNYPNPFQSTTTIEYDLRETSNVHLDIYNIPGQLIKSFDQGVQTSGSHELTLDLDEIDNGTYISVLITNKGSKDEKASQTQLITLEK